MPGQLNMTSASEALKIFYLPGLQYQFANANPVLSVMERDSQSVTGLQVSMALRWGRQGGLGNRADDGLLPTPNSRKTKQAKWDTKNIFARIQVSDKTMRASRNDQGAFVQLLEADLEDAMTDGKDMLSRQLYGNSTGVLATCTAQTAVNTLVLNSVQYLAEGQLIDIVDSAGTVKQAGREVLAVDDVANAITIDGGTVTTLGTDQLVISGNYGLELTGFGSVFTPDNTLYGINRNSNKWFNPTVINIGGEISEVVLQKGSDETERKAGGNVNFYASSYGVRRAYQNLLLATKQIVQPMKLEGGWETLAYNGKPFTADKYAPSGTLFGLDLTTWRFYEMLDWQWLDEDGSVLSRVAGRAVWEAILAKYCDIGCRLPKGNFKMTNIIEH